MDRTEIVIEVELDQADLPTGHVHAADGSIRPFHGWLGLATAITELARRDDPNAQSPTPTNEGAQP